MHELPNAARAMIKSTLENIQEENRADRIIALRRQEAIEIEIGQLETLIVAARKIARMKHPSVEHILRLRDFGFEADRMAELVAAAESIVARE